MKKTITKTKLVLDRETVRSLSSDALRLAVGGLTTSHIGPCSDRHSGCKVVGLSDQEE